MRVLSGRRGIWCVAALAATLLGGLDACAAAAPAARPAIWVSAPAALADQAITVKVTGLVSGQRVAVTARATDGDGRAWRAAAVFTADPAGVVNLATTAPRSGSYRGVDGMGLFWSMTTRAGESGDEYFTPVPPQDRPGFPVRLTVTSGGTTLASRTVTRDWMAPGETARVLSLKTDKVSGVLFRPPPGTPRHPGVLVLGGAEGGMSQVFTAALLAAHGYPALTVAYFDGPGLPGELLRIPLEYFTTAGEILARQPQADPAHVLVMGYSRGSEAALLLADDFPRLFHGAVVYSPSSEVNPAQGNPAKSAWTLHGHGLPSAPIALDSISGPVFAFAGLDDALWYSPLSAARIASELSIARCPYPYQAVNYPNAGQAVGTFPYLPVGEQALHALGGTRAGDVAAQRGSWALVLGQLARLATAT